MSETIFTEDEVEKELDKLQVSPLQRQIIKEKGDIMGKVLDMSPLTIRGFFVKALVEWQQQIGMTVRDSEKIAKGQQETRIEESGQILEIFGQKIRQVLKIRGKEHLLDQAINAAQQHYVDNYAARPYENKE